MSRVKTVALAAGRDNIALPQIYFRRLRRCSAEVVKWWWLVGADRPCGIGAVAIALAG